MAISANLLVCLERFGRAGKLGDAVRVVLRTISGRLATEAHSSGMDLFGLRSSFLKQTSVGSLLKTRQQTASTGQISHRSLM